MDGTEEDAKWLSYAGERNFDSLISERYCESGGIRTFYPATCVGAEVHDLEMIPYWACMRCGRVRIDRQTRRRFLFDLEERFGHQPAE